MNNGSDVIDKEHDDECHDAFAFYCQIPHRHHQQRSKEAEA